MKADLARRKIIVNPKPFKPIRPKGMKKNPQKSETEKKKCGCCGEEIEDGNYFTVWKKDKRVGMYCRKCWFEDEKLNAHLRKMFT